MGTKILVKLFQIFSLLTSLLKQSKKVQFVPTYASIDSKTTEKAIVNNEINTTIQMEVKMSKKSKLIFVENGIIFPEKML